MPRLDFRLSSSVVSSAIQHKLKSLVLYYPGTKVGRTYACGKCFILDLLLCAIKSEMTYGNCNRAFKVSKTLKVLPVLYPQLVSVAEQGIKARASES